MLFLSREKRKCNGCGKNDWNAKPKRENGQPLSSSNISNNPLFVTNTARHSVHSWWRSILIGTLWAGGLCDGSGTRQRRNNRSKNIQFSFFSAHNEAIHQRAPHSYIGVIVHTDFFELGSTLLACTYIQPPIQLPIDVKENRFEWIRCFRATNTIRR